MALCQLEQLRSESVGKSSDHQRPGFTVCPWDEWHMGLSDWILIQWVKFLVS